MACSRLVRIFGPNMHSNHSYFYLSLFNIRTTLFPQLFYLYGEIYFQTNILVCFSFFLLGEIWSRVCKDSDQPVLNSSLDSPDSVEGTCDQRRL